MNDLTNTLPHDSPGGDGLAFIGILVAGIVLFMAVALLAQLMGREWRTWLPGAEGEKSLIHGVKSAVYTFMSNLT